jgi:isopenicillin N synthase-like dioxygenase
LGEGVLKNIDVGGLRGGEAGEVARIGADIGRTCRDTGFFYVHNHGIPDALLSGIFRSAEDFFASPRADKDALSISRSKHNRGYVGLSTESLDPAHVDFKEAFNIGLDLGADDPEVIADKPFRGVNVWPATPGFRDTTLAYFNAVWQLGCDLHEAIAADLKLEPGYFADKFDRPMATLRLLHYPPRAADRDTLGAGEHTDYGSITLLLTDGAGGLDVRRRDGTWIAAPPIPGAFVCNIGDCLMRWSNDTYVSTPHRVRNPPDRDRYSVAFFLDPNPDLPLACLPGCCAAGEAAKYPPILASDYLRQRLDATYGKVRP